LYAAVESCSNFAIELGINIPTGKDSFDETKYPNEEVIAPEQLLFRQVETVPILEKW
jgi:hypothetical protein